MRRAILDTCVWVNGFLQVDPRAAKLIKAIVNQKLEIVISSYGVAEVFTVFRRLSRELKVSVTVLERDIWAIWNQPNVIKEFSTDMTKALLFEVRWQKEIELLAKILELEPKDVPFIVLAYKHKIPLITMDERSLWIKRQEIEKKTGVTIILSKDWSS